MLVFFSFSEYDLPLILVVAYIEPLQNPNKLVALTLLSVKILLV